MNVHFVYLSQIHVTVLAINECPLCILISIPIDFEKVPIQDGRTEPP